MQVKATLYFALNKYKLGEKYNVIRYLLLTQWFELL